MFRAQLLLITTFSQSHQSPNQGPLVHTSIPETVARFANYKHPTAVKNSPLQHQLVVRIFETEYSPLSTAQLPCELDSPNFPKLFSPLKPFRKHSTSPSNHLDTSLEYISRSQESNSSFIVPKLRFDRRPLPTQGLTTDTATLNFLFL